jgi:hypothetical protein
MKSDLLDGFVCSCGTNEPFLFERKMSFDLVGVTYWVVKCKTCGKIHTISWETTLTPLIPTIDHIIDIANKDFDGHFTIYKFTTHYKGFFGTSLLNRKKLWSLPGFKTMKELFSYMIVERPTVGE